MVDVTFESAPVQNMINSFSKTLSRSAVTVVTDNSTGDKTYTYATPANISGAFYKRNSTFAKGREGLFADADAILLVLPSVTIIKDDKITYDNVNYRVDNSEEPIVRMLGTTPMYKVAKLYRIS